jgi:putative hydrolase of the HAD superfamily
VISRKYTHLFFDLDNTLWDFDTSSRLAMHKTFLHYSLDRQSDSFPLFFDTYSRINILLWDEYKKGKLLKKELVLQRFQMTFDEMNIAGIDAMSVNTFYLEEMPLQGRLMPGAGEMLVYLKRKGYTLYIITNGFSEVQHKKLEVTGIAKFFKRVFISEEIKATKPSKEIFEYSVKSANARKKSCMMVGDDFDADINGAINFNMDALYFNRGKLSPGRQIINNKHFLGEISSLTEINNIL